MTYTFFTEFFIPVNNDKIEAEALRDHFIYIYGTEISDDDEKFHITLFQEMVDIIKM